VALTNCPECGAEVATSAKSCPQCGARLTTSILVKVIVGLSILFVGVVVIGVLAKPDPDQQRARTAIEVCLAASPYMHSTTHDEECQAKIRQYKAKYGSAP